MISSISLTGFPSGITATGTCTYTLRTTSGMFIKREFSKL